MLIYIVKNILRDQWAAKLLVLYKQRTSYPEEPSAKKKQKSKIKRYTLHHLDGSLVELFQLFISRNPLITLQEILPLPTLKAVQIFLSFVVFELILSMYIIIIIIIIIIFNFFTFLISF